MTLGEKLQALRKENNMSQEQLASQINVSRQAISKWELNESLPDITNIVQLSNIFKVTTDYLLKEEQLSDDTTNIEVKNNSNLLTGQILLIASTAFLIIGILAAFAGWYENQDADSIIGGMIIQVVGMVGYYIGKVLLKSGVSWLTQFINIAILAFMPISLLSSILTRSVLSPYPIYFPAIKLFIVAYGIVLIISFIILRKKSKINS